MPNAHQSFRSGFTIIELLISLVIIGLIFSVGFASFRSFASRQAIEGATREIKADLRLAQQQAVAGKKPESEPACDSPETLDGYEVQRNGIQSYSIFAVCSGGDVEIKVVDFSEKYPTIQIANFTPFMFRSLAQGVDNNRDITVQEYDGPTVVDTRTIQIRTGGRID